MPKKKIASKQMRKKKQKGQSNSTKGSSFAWHMAELVSPGMPYGS